MKRYREWQGILWQWKAAARKGAGYSRKGQKALAKGKCAEAMDAFQRELAAFQSVSADELSRADNIWGLNKCLREGSKTYCYGDMHGAQEQRVGWARERITGAQARCGGQALLAGKQNGTTATSSTPSKRHKSHSEPNHPGDDYQAAVSAYASSHPRIGTASAIKGNVYWLMDNGTKVPIKSGTPIYFGSRITTEDGGHLRVQLLDDTGLTLGPRSDMVLDEFVYDPNTTAGKIFAQLVKGSFRFVTGKMQHQDPNIIRVKLAVADLGFRGTDVRVKYEPGSEGYIKLSKGDLLITPTAGSPFPMKPGDKAVIRADGSILPPVRKH
jgi:hypothetical protein